MISLEIKPRIIINTSVNGPVQLSERFFEHPLPQNTYGITVFNGGRKEIDILDKEVEIYSRGFPEDPITRRLAAVLSVDDAKHLMLQIPSIISIYNTIILQEIPHQERNFNPDNYPPARIISEPDIVLNNGDPEKIEHPFPSGSEGLKLSFAIRGSSPLTGEKVPMLLLDRTEAINLYENLKKLLTQSCFRGNSAILVEKEFISPSRLVCFV
ncbi:MAG: hypothetical protein Q7R97_02425 [Candidatus Daviesbacteria bacterium]|nr:hypothetical protein [Candidatus Daviesbacteria bacterium]